MDYNYEKETLQAFQEGRLIPEKDGKPWEKEDLETLQDMYYSGTWYCGQAPGNGSAHSRTCQTEPIRSEEERRKMRRLSLSVSQEKMLEGGLNMLNQSDDFLTVDEVCELLKIGHNAAYRMLNTGELKAIRNGRVWRIPKQAIIEFTKEQAKLSWPYHEY